MHMEDGMIIISAAVIEIRTMNRIFLILTPLIFSYFRTLDACGPIGEQEYAYLSYYRYTVRESLSRGVV